jgi:hypothetical protein
MKDHIPFQRQADEPAGFDEMCRHVQPDEGLIHRVPDDTIPAGLEPSRIAREEETLIGSVGGDTRLDINPGDLDIGGGSADPFDGGLF